METATGMSKLIDRSSNRSYARATTFVTRCVTRPKVEDLAIPLFGYDYIKCDEDYCILMPRMDTNVKYDEELTFLDAQFVGVLAYAYGAYYLEYNKRPPQNCYLTQREFVGEPIGDGKKRGKNIVWSKEMDKCLTLELVHQANEGYKVDKGFKDQAYIAACSSLNSSFNLSLSREHCVNHLKTIKKKYRLVHEMLSKSGFSWNPMTKIVECSDQVWTTYVAANPDAKGLRGKKIEMLDELSIVCGNDQATGEWAVFCQGCKC
ncbi:hypothetical protein HYC85_015052 [Camellia sinensis]|uniref:Myb/SANT-like domain-containing protein n=1 Tax=Camellia sinensis TaxID=4442 RepID=A0A7J7H929_CAMSI|nr:hypothetical protein HYC85_015052 [Camellia sinensis]